MLSKNKLSLSLFLIHIYLFSFQSQVIAQKPQSLPLRNPFLHSAGNSINSIPESMNLEKFSPLPNNLILKIYKLSYLKAQEIKDALHTIIPGSKISIEAKSNSIIFLGNQEENEYLQQILRTVDIPSSQVTIEAKVVSINREDSKNIGISWNWDNIPQQIQTGDNSKSLNGGRFRFWQNYSFNFSATLNALVSSGKAKLLASPHIITQPGREGKIFIGDHIPYQIEKHDNSGNYSTTEYIDAGITLTCTPIINNDESILTTEVITEISTPTLVSELKNYRITSRKAATTVSMKSGETLVIGGLITEEEQKAIQKLPLLGNLPILGILFRNKTYKRSNTEILIFLTPYITKPGEAPVIYKDIL